MAGNEIRRVSDGAEDFQVTLPVTKEAFSDFIRDLIGGKSELEYKYDKAIVIDSDLIRGISDSVATRVLGQNQADLVSSTIDIHFKSGRIYRGLSVDVALASAPLGDDLTSFVLIKLIFLVHYPNRPSPSREIVEVAFSRNRFVPEFPDGLLMRDVPLCSAQIKVQSNERSWAEDIVNLVVRCLDTGSDQFETFFPMRRIWFYSFKTQVNFFGSFLIIFTYCLSVYWLMQEMPEQVGQLTGLSFREVLDSLEKIRTDLSPLRIIAAIVAFLSIGVLIATSFLYMVDKLTTDNVLNKVVFRIFPSDERSVSRLQKEFSRDRMRGIAAFVLSIFSGILSALIYDYFFHNSSWALG